jgi:hypothetical protein
MTDLGRVYRVGRVNHHLLNTSSRFVRWDMIPDRAAPLEIGWRRSVDATMIVPVDEIDRGIDMILFTPPKEVTR